jgi:hypothetical protein
MIEVKETTYCLGLWWLEADGVDWLAAVTRESDGPLTLRYRFRYYQDDKAFDSADHKNWWTATFQNNDEDRIIASVDGLAAELRKKGFGRPWRKIVRGGAEDILNAFRQAPFAVFKELPASDN